MGRGLEALIPGAAPPGAAVQEIPVDRIRPNPYQPRRHMDEGALAELVESIRTHGLVQPVVVVPEGDGYVLVAGERRWRAAVRAGLERIPALVRELDPLAMTEVALVENLQREDLNPIEEAYAYRLLHEEFGLTQEEIAQRVGKSRPHVANTLRLLQLDPEVQRMVVEGRLSGGHAKVLVTQPPHAQRELAAEAAARGWSVRELERRLQAQPRARPRPRAAPPRDPHVEDLERRLRQRLGSPVQVELDPDGRGRIVIAVFGLEDLERLLQLLAVDA